MATQGHPQGPQGNPFNIRPGQQPTPEQIAAMQRQLAIDAQKNGMTVPEFVAKLKQQQAAIQQAQAQQQAAQQGGQPQQQGQAQQGAPQPITPGPPKPEALAVAKFLKSQDLKPRTCILNGQRKDMFKGRVSLISGLLTLLIASQLSVPSELWNHQITPKPARRTLCSPRSPTAPPSKIRSSSFPSRSSPSECPKSIPMKDTTTPQGHTRRRGSRVSGQSRSSNSKNAAKNYTSSGSMKGLKSKQNSTPRAFWR
jgi:hypothetical protein